MKAPSPGEETSGVGGEWLQESRKGAKQRRGTGGKGTVSENVSAQLYLTILLGFS